MNDKLYIIGNGFDLHHGLKTSYDDFRENQAKKSPDLWKLLKIIYGNKINESLWWRDFEEMLGKIDYANVMNSYNGLALGQNMVQNLLIGILPPLFEKWIKTIDAQINTTKPIMAKDIDENALFFTFNYTLLLEKVYNVPKDNVWHIHHSVREKNGDSVIVGHDSDDRMLFKDYIKYRKEHQINYNDIADYIIQKAAKGAKGVKNRILRHEDDFNRLYANIKHFVAMGFSFNDIDMPYIEKIIAVNKNIADSDWTLYWHSDGEGEMMKEKLKQLGVSDGCITLIPW